MAGEPEQNLANHSRTDYLYVAGAGLIVVALLISLWGLISAPSVGSIGYVLLCAGIVCGYWRIRTYALILQDRIIMMEMRVRLERLLGSGEREKIAKLTRPQLIGLRFASDGELPELVEKTLRENLVKAGDIKKLVKNWQADHQRV